MRNKVIALLFATLFSVEVSAQQRMTTSEYIAIYSDLAIATMKKYHIPASIKMAQAILESASGNSVLATKGNNHFGIKCKNEWTGATMLHDDDAKDECFRKYETVYDSYIDHSKFLTSRDRYASLFKLDISDYKAWADGLKAAGYATNPLYAQNLIRIIEANKLYKLDEKALQEESAQEEAKVEITPVVAEQPTPKQEVKPTTDYSNVEIYRGVIANVDDYIITTGKGIPTYLNNGAKFVVAREDETLEAIASQSGVSVKKLVKYNEFRVKPTSIEKGSIIYISSKKSKASNGYTYHTVAKGETLHYVSQKYGIKIDKLASMNLYTRNYTIKVGQKMLLR